VVIESAVAGHVLGEVRVMDAAVTRERFAIEATKAELERLLQTLLERHGLNVGLG
jgi:hypothetical protein